MIDADGEKILGELEYGEKIRLEIGYGLIPLVDPDQGGKLLEIIRGTRRGMSRELGFLIQPIHICDSHNFPPDRYRIYLHQIVEAEEEIEPHKLLAINAGWRCENTLPGKHFKEPAHGWDSVWIACGWRIDNQAAAMGS